MIRFLLAGIVVVAIGGTAQAADIVPSQLPTEAPVVAAPLLYSWSGCYVGAHIGGGWSNKEWFQEDGDLRFTHNADGFLGGGQVGEDPGECSSEHRLAGTRWANEHQMVPPCCGDLEGASCPKLTPDGAQIDGSSTIRGWRRLCRQTVILSEGHRHRVRQAAHTAHITTRQGRLGDPRRRHEARRRATRRHDPGSEAAPRRTYGAVERQLADGDDVGRRGMYLT